MDVELERLKLAIPFASIDRKWLISSLDVELMDLDTVAFGYRLMLLTAEDAMEIARVAGKWDFDKLWDTRKASDVLYWHDTTDGREAWVERFWRYSLLKSMSADVHRGALSRYDVADFLVSWQWGSLLPWILMPDPPGLFPKRVQQKFAAWLDELLLLESAELRSSLPGDKSESSDEPSP
ncbi:MAG: hypothetical protein JWQ12_1258 [Glaciihabitans sp.]|nr:hypothetical protein [Glaciihabitans sp.]